MLDKITKSRLIWHCRRGMLELDLILNQFIAQRLDNITEKQLSQFDHLLTYTDPELFSWLMGHELPPNDELLEIVSFIRTPS